MDKRLWFLCLIALPMLPVAALAALQPTCRNGDFSAKADIMPGRIIAKPGDRIFFRGFDNGNFAIRAWERGTYLASGDAILVAHPYGRWICAFHLEGDQAWAGWIARSNVKTLPFPLAPPLRAWVGRWSWTPDITVTIREMRSNALGVDAKARCDGPIVRAGERDVHFGGVAGIASPHGNVLVLSGGSGSDACVVHLRLIAQYLIANDNAHCGGVNVRVEGVLTRVPKEGE